MSVFVERFFLTNKKRDVNIVIEFEFKIKSKFFSKKSKMIKLIKNEVIAECMFKITKIKIAYTLVSIIFVLFQIFINQNKIISNTNQNIMKSEVEDVNVEEANIVAEEQEEVQIEGWLIEIPKISLKANIAEGTSKDVLNQYVGHFEKTNKEYGNVGLAAHNRGYEVNFFQDLKLLKKGDEIKYTYNQFEKIYEVEKCRIIKDTDWEYLDDTEDNRLTLITCVENQPEYRRCIQAVEKEEVRY